MRARTGNCWNQKKNFRCLENRHPTCDAMAECQRAFLRWPDSLLPNTLGRLHTTVREEDRRRWMRAKVPARACLIRRCRQETPSAILGFPSPQNRPTLRFWRDGCRTVDPGASASPWVNLSNAHDCRTTARRKARTTWHHNSTQHSIEQQLRLAFRDRRGMAKISLQTGSAIPSKKTDHRHRRLRHGTSWLVIPFLTCGSPLCRHQHRALKGLV